MAKYRKIPVVIEAVQLLNIFSNSYEGRKKLKNR